MGLVCTVRYISFIGVLSMIFSSLLSADAFIVHVNNWTVHWKENLSSPSRVEDGWRQNWSRSPLCTQLPPRWHGQVGSLWHPVNFNIKPDHTVTHKTHSKVQCYRSPPPHIHALALMNWRWTKLQFIAIRRLNICKVTCSVPFACQLLLPAFSVGATWSGHDSKHTDVTSTKRLTTCWQQPPAAHRSLPRLIQPSSAAAREPVNAPCSVAEEPLWTWRLQFAGDFQGKYTVKYGGYQSLLVI